ncbi:MAG: S-layer homology domain-containing protein [Clostridia bacterium]|nr:S-layer homology domain-containing protein [Clostridia bacterium]
MKKLLSLIIVFAISSGFMTAVNASYSDVSSSDSYAVSALRLQDLGILSGYEDGSFRPDNTITRAEFTKIVVCMMDKETEAKSSAGLTGFFDVDIASWHTHYIRYAVNRDILSGYADGSFRPDNTITVSEAVTILLRTLGYNEDEVGYFWPDNYMSAANSLGLFSGLDLSADTPVTRRTAAVLVDRAIFAKPSASLSADTYLETTGYTVLKDSLVLSNNSDSESVTILSGNLKQNNASSYLKRTQLPVHSGDIYNFAVIDKKGYLTTVREYTADDNLASVSGSVNKLTGNTIEYTTTDGFKSSYNADENFTVYFGADKLTLAAARERITNGIDITFYGNSYGLWNIAVIGSSDSISPILASKDYNGSDSYIGNILIKSANLTVYRNGEAATLSDIKAGDVVYYNTKTNVMDVYAKKVTGTYYSAYPSKAYVESVSVGGKTYEIGYSAATDRLNASATAFNIGDRITLLLGKNDKIAFVTDNASGFDYSSYGVVLKSEARTATEGENKGNTEFTATLFMTDGEEHTIVTNKLYKDIVGSFVSINYKNGAANLQKVAFNSADEYEGKIDRQNRTINGKYVLKDAVIIQRTSSKNADTATCELLSFDSLTATKLLQGQLITAISGNAFGDIAILYVEGFENTDNFGIVTGFIKAGDEKVGYKVFSNGVYASYSSSVNSAVMVGDAVSFRVENGEITKILPIRKIVSSGNITAIDGGRISIGSTVYSLSDKVQIIDITDVSKYKSITTDELEKMLSPSVTLYSDTAGGNIRVITVTR